MKITERRIVKQDWYETETTKTGLNNHGWFFIDGSSMEIDLSWTIVQHIHLNKFGNPFVGVAEREVDV